MLIAAGLSLQACERPGAISSSKDKGVSAGEPTYTTKRVSFPPSNMPNVLLPSGKKRPIASIINISAAMNYGEFTWDDTGVPPGPVWILVDLSAQTMSVFRGRHEIGTAITLYGVDDKPTPLGRFTVLERRKDHHSNLYDAPMPFMLRLTNDGVAIHGSDVREGAGTHGCLGVPLEFGSHLFEAMRVSDEVIILADGRPVARGTSKAS